MKILHKYILKEHLGPLLFSFSALTSILMLQTVAKQFGNLVGKGLPASVIVQFFALSLPYTLALTLPMSVLVATLYAFSRLASENEITALKASGVGLSRVLAPVLIAAVGVTIFMLFFNDQILPRTNHQLSLLMTDIAQTKPTFALREQVINEVTPGRLYLRANHIEASHLMREVTIYDMTDATRRRTIVADSGTLGMAPNKMDLFMTLYDGVMQDVPTAKPEQLQRLFFHTDLIRVKGVANQFQKSTGTDNRGPREQSVCQMQLSVEKATDAYVAARHDFLENVRRAGTMSVRLNPFIAQTQTKMPPRVTLGGTYCQLLRWLHVPELTGQKMQDTQQVSGSSPRARPAPPAPTPPVLVPGRITIKEITPTPVPTPAPTPALIPQTKPAPPGATLPAPSTQPAPPPPLYITSALIDNARVRLIDASTMINMTDVEIHKKFALAVACFVFVLLGAPIALRFPRGGVGLTIGASLLVFAIYYIGLIAGASLGSRGIIAPWIAMWVTNVIFGLVGIFMVSRMGKEGSTARGGDLSDIIDNVKRRFGGRRDVVKFVPDDHART